MDIILTFVREYLGCDLYLSANFFLDNLLWYPSFYFDLLKRVIQNNYYFDVCIIIMFIFSIIKIFVIYLLNLYQLL